MPYSISVFKYQRKSATKSQKSSVDMAQNADLWVTLGDVSLRHSAKPFVWLKAASPHKGCAMSSKSLNQKMIRFTSHLTWIWTHLVLFWTEQGKGVLIVMMISLCSIYTILCSTDRTFSHAKREYKNNHGIFPLLQNPQSSPHAQFTTTWRLSKLNKRKNMRPNNMPKA